MHFIDAPFDNSKSTSTGHEATSFNHAFGVLSLESQVYELEIVYINDTQSAGYSCKCVLTHCSHSLRDMRIKGAEGCGGCDILLLYRINYCVSHIPKT
jgi:hypothetical protein